MCPESWKSKSSDGHPNQVQPARPPPYGTSLPELARHLQLKGSKSYHDVVRYKLNGPSLIGIDVMKSMNQIYRPMVQS